MITRFKMFENINIKDLKKGDYVIVDCADLGINNEVMIVDEDPDSNADGFTVVMKKYNNPNYTQTFYDHEIVKKIKPEEVELYIDAKKYNL